MRVSINGVPLETADKRGISIVRDLIDSFKGTADAIGGFAINPFGSLWSLFVNKVFIPLNNISPEIITLGIIFCAGGIMIGSIFGKTHTWVSRTFLVLWGGVIWRILF